MVLANIRTAKIAGAAIKDLRTFAIESNADNQLAFCLGIRNKF
ncbi:hypothetical protein [Paraburkholderia sacchari]|nr:hypothetical protein [Paraburkholderia sacchari]